MITGFGSSDFTVTEEDNIVIFYVFCSDFIDKESYYGNVRVS